MQVQNRATDIHNLNRTVNYNGVMVPLLAWPEGGDAVTQTLKSKGVHASMGTKKRGKGGRGQGQGSNPNPPKRVRVRVRVRPRPSGARTVGPSSTSRVTLTALGHPLLVLFPLMGPGRSSTRRGTAVSQYLVLLLCLLT